MRHKAIQNNDSLVSPLVTVINGLQAEMSHGHNQEQSEGHSWHVFYLLPVLLLPLSCALGYRRHAEALASILEVGDETTS